MSRDRPLSDVLEDILPNLQDIVRSEVRLARAEIRAGATQAAASALWVTADVVKRLSPLPEWTVQTTKENVEWMKQSAK